MSLVSLFTSVKNQLLANTTTIFTAFNPSITSTVLPFIHVWNRPLFEGWKQASKKLAPGELKENDSYGVLYPAIMVEFLNSETEQLGNGEQIYSNLTVRIHIAHMQIDAGDGTMEQNLQVYAVADAVQQALQKFYSGGLFIRKRQGLDPDYNDLYHYTIDYDTTYVDSLMAEPVNGKTISGGSITPEIEIEYNPAPYIKP